MVGTRCASAPIENLDVCVCATLLKAHPVDTQTTMEIPVHELMVIGTSGNSWRVAGQVTHPWRTFEVVVRVEPMGVGTVEQERASLSGRSPARTGTGGWAEFVSLHVHNVVISQCRLHACARCWIGEHGKRKEWREWCCDLTLLSHRR